MSRLPAIYAPKQRLTSVVVLLTLTILLSSPLSAKVIYVNGGSGSDANNGLTWATSKKTVTAGLNSSVSGDEIWVAAGTYVERITLMDGVALYGGFTGTETSRDQRDWQTNQSILDGNQGGSVVTSPTGVTNSARIDGFIIRNSGVRGYGGILVDSSSPSIYNNTIAGNHGSYGGGIRCDSSGAVIIGNVISNNEAAGGGGIYCIGSDLTVEKNRIMGNYGGGIACHSSNVDISGNQITDNAGYYGGIYCTYGGNSIISNNIISGNSTGIHCDGSGPIIHNNSINYNSGYGGIYCWLSGPIITNNTINANDVGGIHCDDFSEPAVSNNIIVFNSTGIYISSYSYARTLRNNCVFGNSSYNYSGLTAGVGDISFDPLFVDLEAGNYHLQPGSPCIDAGDNSAVQAGWVDMDGQPRIANGIVDIGADEFYQIDTTPPTKPVVTDSGQSSADLTSLSAAWTSSDPEMGVAEYQYAIGTTPSLEDTTYVVNWTSVGTATEVTANNLTLENGRAYFIYVNARNGAGLWSEIGTSDGIVVGETPWSLCNPIAMPRWANALVADDTALYSVGGFIDCCNTGHTMTADIDKYNIATDTWSHLTQLPTAKGNIAATLYANSIYMFGGGDHYSASNEAMRFDPLTNTWHSLPNLPTARHAAKAVTIGGKIYVIGGSDSSGTLLSVCEEYNPATNTWSSRSPMPTPRAPSILVVIDGRIYVVGGWGHGWRPEIEIFDPAFNTWQSDGIIPFEHLADGAAVGRHIWMISGDSPQFTITRKVVSYDTQLRTWTEHEPIPLGSANTACSTGTTIFMVGGRTGLNSTSVHNIVQKYNVSDTIPPDSTITSGPSEGSFIGSSGAVFEFTGSDDVSAVGVLKYQTRLDGGEWSAASAATSVTYSNMADGVHTFEVRAVDEAGNVDTTPALRTWTVDTTPPDTNLIAGPSENGYTSASATFEFSGTDNISDPGNMKYQTRLDGGDWSASSSETSANLSDLTDGPHKFEVRAVDEAGNVDPTPLIRNWKVDTTPPLMAREWASSSTQACYYDDCTNSVTSGCRSGDTWVYYYQVGGCTRWQEVSFAFDIPNPELYSDTVYVMDKYYDTYLQGGNYIYDDSFLYASDTFPYFRAYNGLSAIIQWVSAFTVYDISMCAGLSSHRELIRTSPSLPYLPITAIDYESGASEYEYALGRTPCDNGQEYVTSWTLSTAVPWLNASKYYFQLAIDYDSLTPAHGDIYYVYVRAKNGAGVWSPTYTVAGYQYDLAPDKPSVTDQGETVRSNNTLTATWTANDPVYDIIGYQYAIGNKPVDDGTDYVVPYTTTQETSATLTNLELEVGETYYWYVKATNSGGYTSIAGVSDGILVYQPIQEPTTGNYFEIIPGAFSWSQARTDAETRTWLGRQGQLATLATQGEREFISNNLVFLNTLNATHFWMGGFQDKSLPGVVEPSGGWKWISGEPWNYTFWANGQPDNIRYTNLPGQPYEDYLEWNVNLGAWNDLLETAGIPQYRTHQGYLIEYVIIDNTAPDTTITAGPTNGSATSATVADFTFTGSDNVTTPANLKFQWKLDAGAWSAASAATIVNLTNLTPGSHTFSVRAIDEAGNVDSTPAVVIWFIDVTPPGQALITDGGLHTSDLTRLTANWLFTDNQTAIVEYQYAIGTSPTDPGSGYAVNWTSTAQTNVTANFALQNGWVYYWYVRARNAAGLWSAVAVSDGIKAGLPVLNPQNGHYYEVVPYSGGANLAKALALTRTFQGKGGYLTTITSPEELAWLKTNAGAVNPLQASELWSGGYQDANAPDFEEPDGGWRWASGEPWSFTNWHVNGEPNEFQNRGENFLMVHTAQNWQWYDLQEDGVGYIDGYLVEYGAPDTTPPTTPVVGDTGQYLGQGQSLQFNWSSSDPETLVAEYEYAVGLQPADPGSGYTVGWTSAGANASVTLASLSPQNGFTYFAYVRARNTAGLWSAVGVSDGIKADLFAPETSLLQAPASGQYTNLTNPVITFAGSDNFTQTGQIRFQWKLDAADWTELTTVTSANLASLADGLHTFQVRAVDLAGNVDQTPAQVSWLVDTVAPDTQIVTHPPVLSGQSTATFTLSGSDNASALQQLKYRWRLDGGVWSVASSNTTVELTSLSDGSHTFEAQAIDLAGNIDPTPASFTWTSDASPPTVPVVVDEGEMTPNTTTLFASWSATDAQTAVVEYRYAIGTSSSDPGAGYVRDWTSTGSVAEVAAVGLKLNPGTTYFFYVQAKNQAGHWSAVGVSDGILLPADAPFYYNNFEVGAGPEWSVQTREATPGTPTRPSDNFLGQFSAGAVGLELNGLPDHDIVKVDFELFAIRSWDGNAVLQGQQTVGPDYLEVTAGLDSLFKSTFSNIGFSPSFTYQQSYPDSYPGGANPPWTGALEVNSLGYLVDFGGLYQGPLDSVYRITLEYPHTAAELSLSFVTSLQQALSDEGWGLNNVSVKLVSDETPPETEIVSAPSGFVASGSAVVTFTGSDDRTATPELLFQHRLNGGEWSAASSATSASLTNLPQGLQTSEVRAIDLAGNIDPTPAAASWTVDTIPPSTPTVTDGGAYTLSQNTLTASWTSTDGGSGIAGYQYAVGTSPTDPGSGYILGWTSAGVNTSASISGLGLNLGQTYYIYVKATDAAGLTSLSGASDGIIVAPQVSVSPGGAKLLANGTTVALQGVIVTASSAQMNGRLYVTDTGRSSGIAVSSNSAAAVGDVVSIAGTMSATTDGERIIVNPQVSSTGATVPVAGMEMILRSVASWPFYFNNSTGAGQRGHTDPIGTRTSTIGMLITTGGTVSDIDGSFIYINDGSFFGSAGVRVDRTNILKTVALNDWLTVTGIASMRRAGLAYQPVLRPRTDADVVRY